MSKKRRFELHGIEESFQEEDQQEEVEETPQESPKIPFAHWFDRKVKEGRLRHHQDEALLVFLKKQGLSEFESIELFNNALLKF